MRTRAPGFSFCLVAAAFALAPFTAVQAGEPGRAAAQAGAGPLEPPALETLDVPTWTGSTRFLVRHPDAQISTAWRHNDRRVEKTGNTPDPTAGFELTDRIVVRSDSPAAIRELLGSTPPLTARPVSGATGYWTLHAGSIREAVAVANRLAATDEIAEAYLDLTPPWTLRTLPTDPRFPQQWHLHNVLDPLFDVNAEPAWDAGYTGAGVVIGIVEQAWQHNHPDLIDHYYADASQEGGIVTSHATSCAGVAAAVAFNDIMGAGMAYGARLSDQLFGSASETAEALAFRNDLNDIKSNSWGPADVGQIAYMPSVVRSSIEESIASGRGGRGEIFVWAAGNGGTHADRVDYDPYASSRFTIAVGAVGDADVRASYNEKGSSMLVVAHSSGNDRSIGTTASGSGWTSSFGGTSAACPLAAGAIALMLEASPGMTWRDVQHALIESARLNDPNHPGWTTNGAGYHINYNYGFGAVDAAAAVALAASWQNVPHELVVDTGVVTVDAPIPDNDPNGVSATATISDNIRLEFVELILNVQTTFVGDLDIVLIGPSGTRSQFAKQRSVDGQDDYTDYLFTSVRHWGEQSAGDWTIEIADRFSGDLATWVDYRLIFYGTPVCPGDLSEDGEIGLGDLAELLRAYRACEGDPLFNPAADFDNSRCIDLSDLAYLISVYGQTCP